MSMYAGDELYDDDVTSGPIEDGRYDDDPNPYEGTMSDE